MLANPAHIDKYLYVEKTSTWVVRTLYLFGIVSWLLILYGYVNSLGVDFFFTYFVFPAILFLTLYHLTSFGLNLFYRKFNLNNHLSFIKNFWTNTNEPFVDIFLPVCDEDIRVLRNTWSNVSQLNYKNKRIYVLNDSVRNCKEHEKLAQEFGFIYVERPNKREMKKAGNLKYGFEHSIGDYIAIFDADFAPHPDFLTETVPYMSDPNVGIVQTPQYFETSNTSYQQSPLAYNAAYAEEPFYRIIQVTRNRFHGAICCGSNAVYRRSALEKIGGPYQIEQSEDAHTGFALTSIGYQVFYIPVILAIGMCPDNYYTFFHQQHRWSTGSMRLLFSKKFWFAPISWKIKFCYITGFLFYLHHPLMILFSFHLFWVLFLYNEFIPYGGDILYYPHLLFAILYLLVFPIARFRIGFFGVLIARTYAYTHAIFSVLFGKSVGWVSTNASHSSVSPAFLQTITFVSLYVYFSVFFVLLGVRTGDIHLFDLHYWSIQFWIFYNLLLSLVLLWNLFSATKRMKTKGANIQIK